MFGTYISNDDNVIVTVNGTTPADANDVFEDYADRLTDAGFSEETSFNQDDEFYSATFIRGDTTVGVTTQAGGDSTDVIIIVD